MAMEECEEESAGAAMLMFAGEEDPFPRHEAVFEYHIGIRGTRDKPALEGLPGPVVMNCDYLFHSFPVTRDGKGDGVVLVLLA